MFVRLEDGVKLHRAWFGIAGRTTQQKAPGSPDNERGKYFQTITP